MDAQMDDKIVGKGEKAGNQHFLLSSAKFSTFPNTNLKFSFKFILPSANAFNSDKSKNLLFGKELTPPFYVFENLLLKGC